jgi:tetratricopeptide (TPR) repeat protein
VAVVICSQLLLAFRDRVFALGTIIFWAGLLPVANLVPIYRPMADRFLYLPLMGLAMLLARGLHAAGRLRPEWRLTLYCATGAWICTLGLISFQREPVWHDSVALWQDTAAANPYSTTAANNLGWALFDAGRPLDAAAAFRRDIDLTHAKDADPWAGLALASDAAGAPAMADAAYAKAAALDGRYSHPEELVAALVMEREDAGKLEVLARRNTNP